MIVPLLTAAMLRARGGARPWGGLGLAFGAAAAAFLIANPYALLDFDTFRADLERQSTVAGESDKLGLDWSSGHLYYLWTFTWGLGWVPALLAVAGAVSLWTRNRALALVLVPVVPVFWLYMGLQERFFGRWMLPLFPLLCVLAALGAVAVAEAVAARRPSWRRPALALVAVALVAQPLVHTVHGSRVLSRPDTRTLARAWMEPRIPPGTRIVLESIVPREWVHDADGPSLGTPDGYRWLKFFKYRAELVAAGVVERGELPGEAQVDNYERYLHPALLDVYERLGLCWVITGSTQEGRALAEPEEVPDAIAYYRELRRRGRVVQRFSPYDDGAGPVKFNYDWSFDYYPLAYARPGPAIEIRRLAGGRCAASA